MKTSTLASIAAAMALIGVNTVQGASLYRIDFTQSDPTMANGTIDAITAGFDSDFGSDGTDTWNRFDSGESGAGTYGLTSSLGASGVASFTHAGVTGGTGNGQGDGNNALRGGYFDWTSPSAFSLSLGAGAANAPVTFAWYVLGATQPFTHAIEVTGGTPNVVQASWGSGNVVFQTVTADGSGNVAGIFRSNAGTNSNGDIPLSGMQVHVGDASSYVPEPSSVMLIGLGGIFLRRVARRQQK